MSPRSWQPLEREEVLKAVERRGPRRIPMILAKWWGVGLNDQYGERLLEFDRFPNDSQLCFIDMCNPFRMNLSWELKQTGGIDSRCVIDDWAKLDEYVEKLPVPDRDDGLAETARIANSIYGEGVHVHFGWWNLFFEKPWTIRGMESLMMDYHENPDEVHRLHDALCATYCAYIDWAARNMPFDGFWTSDDLGHQHNLMMSPEIFDDMIQPYYARVGATVHKHGKKFWLHSCGDNTHALPGLVEAGVDVFHPVQKGTMDEVGIAREYGDRLSFLAGFDVQKTLYSGTPEEVRAEVRHLIDTFDRPDGGMCIAAGNGIVSGTPFDNIEAYLEEAARYGEEHRAKVGA